MNAKDLIGYTLRGSSAPETDPHTHTIAEVWQSKEDQAWVAWSVDSHNHGEHLRATSEAALVRRVMALR